MDLKNKSCVACHVGMVELKPEEIEGHLKGLGKSWGINDKGHLEKTFELKDFQEAMDFAIKISVVAESKGHHPNLYIAWGKCVVEIWTHKVNGLTEEDFILAAGIEGMAS